MGLLSTLFHSTYDAVCAVPCKDPVIPIASTVVANIEPSIVTVPVVTVFVVITLSIVSPVEPDFLRYIAPSATFIANSPYSKLSVDGIEPLVRLRLCKILSLIY